MPCWPTLRALAGLTAAALVDRDEAHASFARLAGRPIDDGAFAAAVVVARTARDHSSATAIPRRDMNPALAARLGIQQGRGLAQGEVGFLLNGQRADGGQIKGKEIQSSTRPLRDISILHPASAPTVPSLPTCWPAGARTAMPCPRTKLPAPSPV